MDKNFQEARAADTFDRARQISRNDTAADIPASTASLGAGLETLRDVQRKTFALLVELHDTLTGPGPENGEAKRPSSQFLIEMTMENIDLAEGIQSMARRALQLLGDRKK